MKARTQDGNVKIYNKLPNEWNGVENVISHYFDRDDLHEQDGFFDVVEPPKTDSQKYATLTPADFNNETKVFTKVVVDKTPEELQIELDKDASAIKNEKYQVDGKREHKRFWDYVMRNFDDDVIDDLELDEISTTLYLPTQPLVLGFWKIAKNIVADIEPSENGKVNFAINKVKNGIDQYILNNY